MAARAQTWRCRSCLSVNHWRKRKCEACGRKRPPKRRPQHLRALDLTYEQYVELNGGDRCGICGKPPSETRRLDRDHDHKSGRPRGLLDSRCNRALPSWVTPEWLRAAADYLEREDAA